MSLTTQWEDAVSLGFRKSWASCHLLNKAKSMSLNLLIKNSASVKSRLTAKKTKIKSLSELPRKCSLTIKM